MTHEQVKQAIAKAIYQEKQQTASAIENFLTRSQRPETVKELSKRTLK